MLYLVQRVFFGPLKEGDRAHAVVVRDLSAREIVALAPLVVFVFWIGVYPRFFLDRMRPTLEPLVRGAAVAIEDRGRHDPHGVRVLAGKTLRQVGEPARDE